jgi:endonuclease-3
VSPARRRALFAALAKADPEPKGELVYGSDFELLVAVVLSAQATDKSVNAATRGLFAQARSPAAMLELGEAGLVEHIRTIGLFRTKARNILALCRQLIAEHQGVVPRTREALEALPGVGRKTANVVLNIAFGEPSIAVDTHVFRVANRTGLAPGKNVRAVEDALLKAVPKDYLHNAHHWLILHGRYVCKARTPECWRCVIAPMCTYADKTAEPVAAAQLLPGRTQAAARAPRPNAPAAGKIARQGSAKNGKSAKRAKNAQAVKDAVRKAPGGKPVRRHV